MALPPSHRTSSGLGTDMSTKRALLMSARARFAPETQTLKQAAIDKTVEQALLVTPEGVRLSLPAVHHKVDETLGNGSAISQGEVREALARLVRESRVEGVGTGLDQRTYALLPAARASLREAQSVSDRRLSQLVNRLFKRAPGTADSYATPFFECLRLIFGQVADSYVRQITGHALPEEILTHQAVAEALTECEAAFPSVDASALRRGVMAFLTEVDPDSSEVKWNLTQNSYLLRALGLDERGFLLSREVLGGAVLYLDTNVLIQALEPRARLHRSCIALARACTHLGISLRVAQVSVMELRGVIAYNKEVMSKVVDQIPDETAPKVESIFFQAYREAQLDQPELTVDEFFANYEDLSGAMGAMGCETVDDRWFVDNKTDAKTKTLAGQIRSEYDSRHPEQAKRERAATHDALMIRWVERERLSGSPKSWLVTLDTSLPSFVPDEGAANASPLAITLDALLQWISPMASREGFDEDLSDIFSAALRQQILPHENFFTLQDFLVFAELDCSCRNLPAEDVEECIRCLGAHTHVDLSDARNREVLAHEIATFFADPGRKYKGALEQLEAQLQKKDDDIRALITAHETAMSEVKHEANSRSDQLEAELGLLRDEQTKANEALTAERNDRAEETRHSRLVASARRRSLLSVGLLIVVESVVVYLALKYSTGDNGLQKVMAFWPLVAVAGGISLLVGATLIIGHERLRLLPDVVRALFGLEPRS